MGQWSRFVPPTGTNDPRCTRCTWRPSNAPHSGHWSWFIPPTGTYGSTVPVGGINRDQWPPIYILWAVQEKPPPLPVARSVRSSLPLSPPRPSSLSHRRRSPLLPLLPAATPRPSRPTQTPACPRSRHPSLQSPSRRGGRGEDPPPVCIPAVALFFPGVEPCHRSFSFPHRWDPRPASNRGRHCVPVWYFFFLALCHRNPTWAVPAAAWRSAH
jgi:hypothetical protein